MPKRKHRSSSPSASPKKRKHKSKSSTLLDAVHESPDLTAPALFQKARLKIHVAVPPAAAAEPSSLSTYMLSHLTSTLLLKHTENGTIVAFSDFASLSGVGRVLDECPFSWSWFEGDVVLFNPRIGQRISNFPLSPLLDFVEFGGLIKSRRDSGVEFSGSYCIVDVCSFQCFDTKDPNAQGLDI